MLCNGKVPESLVLEKGYVHKILIKEHNVKLTKTLVMMSLYQKHRRSSSSYFSNTNQFVILIYTSLEKGLK